MYKDIFREVGILTMLSNALKEYASQLKEDGTGMLCKGEEGGKGRIVKGWVEGWRTEGVGE